MWGLRLKGVAERFWRFYQNSRWAICHHTECWACSRNLKCSNHCLYLTKYSSDLHKLFSDTNLPLADVVMWLCFMSSNPTYSMFGGRQGETWSILLEPARTKTRTTSWLFSRQLIAKKPVRGDRTDPNHSGVEQYRTILGNWYHVHSSNVAPLVYCGRANELPGTK